MIHKLNGHVLNFANEKNTGKRTTNVTYSKLKKNIYVTI
jgi:hypothetical protein